MLTLLIVVRRGVVILFTALKQLHHALVVTIKFLRGNLELPPSYPTAPLTPIIFNLSVVCPSLSVFVCFLPGHSPKLATGRTSS